MDLSVIGPAVAALLIGVYIGVAIGINLPNRGGRESTPPKVERSPGTPILIILGDPGLVPLFRSHFPEAQVVSVADPGWHSAKLGLHDVLMLYRQAKEASNEGVRDPAGVA